MTRQRRIPTDDSREPIDLFRSIRSKIAQRANGGSIENITVDLLPVDAETADESRTVDEFRTIDETRTVDESRSVDESRTLDESSTVDDPRSSDPRSSADAPESVPQFGIGDVLSGRYVIEGQLGSGGMGTVYKALDRARIGHIEANGHVAVKVLHAQTRDRPDVMSKLRQEFYCAQALSHPSIVKVYELDVEQELPFFTMELIDGEILPKVMQRFHPLPLPRDYAWAVIREVGAGIKHAHDRLVLHGDIKPQNIMITSRGEVRILDFGRSGGSTTALTPAYASCELLEGRSLDPRDDLFALACVSYELLAGEHPFQHRRSTDARTAKMTPRRPAGLSGRQWKALSDGLAWNRENRPQSVREWLEQLQIGNEPMGPVPLRPVVKAVPFLKSKVTYTLIALTAVALVCGITWAVLSRPKLPAAVIEAADSNTTIAPPLNVASVLAEVSSEEAEAPPEAPAPAKVNQNHAAGAPGARPIDKTERISVESAAYPIRAGAKFAEVRVHRSTGSKGGTSFDWWTEPGSALEDTDYAPQAPTTTFFPAGKRSVSVFVKLLPKSPRKRTEVFYVVLGNPSAGTALGGVSKAAVALNP
jgi:serine/threonine protein kinase